MDTSTNISDTEEIDKSYSLRSKFPLKEGVVSRNTQSQDQLDCCTCNPGKFIVSLSMN